MKGSHGMCWRSKSPVTLRPFRNKMQASQYNQKNGRRPIRAFWDHHVYLLVHQKMLAARSICWFLFVSLQLTFLCAFLDSNWQFYGGVRDRPLNVMSRDAAMEYGDRFKILCEHLPTDVRIGYFTDRAEQEYYLSQYHLTPHILLLNRRLRYVVENLHSKHVISPLDVSSEYRLIYAEENGVRLFKRKDT